MAVDKVTTRTSALRFPGDRTEQVHVGQAMGPGTDGFYRRVTAVTYDLESHMTRVELEVIEEALDEGQRLRFHGSADGSDEPPPERPPLTEEVTPR